MDEALDKLIADASRAYGGYQHRDQLANGTATVRLTWEALHGEAELFKAILAQRSGRSG